MVEGLSRLLVPIHSDGHKYLAVAAALAILALFFAPGLGLVLLALTAAIAFLFRDPARVTPLREGLVLAPSDGEVISIEQAEPPPELAMEGGKRARISIYQSLADVAMTRAPVAGRVVRSVYIPGSFVSAVSEAASEENERRSLILAAPGGQELAVAQVAGFLGRRIVTLVGEGDTIGIGQRIGNIRLGCRIDVYLPPDQAPLVAVGQRTVSGETVLADLKSDEPEREARRG